MSVNYLYPNAIRAEITIERNGEYIAVIDTFNSENATPIGEKFRRANRKKHLRGQSALDLSMLQDGDLLWIGMGKWLVYNGALHTPHLRQLFSNGEYISNPYLDLHFYTPPAGYRKERMMS